MKSARDNKWMGAVVIGLTLTAGDYQKLGISRTQTGWSILCAVPVTACGIEVFSSRQG